MKLFLHALALSLTLVPVTLFAQESFAPLTSIPGLVDAGNSPNISVFLNQLYKICIGAAAIIAVLQIIRAGILFMTNKGSISENEQARSLLQGAVFGLILVLSPVVVFNIINPKILDLNFSAERLETQAQPSSGTTGGDDENGPTSAVCTDRTTYDAYQYADVPAGGVCSDVLGDGWANAWPAQASCCAGEQGEGQTCCAHAAYYRPPPTPPSATEFNIGTQKLEDDLDAGGGAKCRMTYYQPFDTQALCEAQEANVLAGRFSGMVLTKKCDGSSVTPPQPAATWATMSSARVCPS